MQIELVQFKLVQSELQQLKLVQNRIGALQIGARCRLILSVRLDFCGTALR